MLASLLVLLAIAPSGAVGAPRPAKVVVERSSTPNAAGWYARSATGEMRLKVTDGSRRIDFCSWSTLTQLPSGDGHGFARYWRQAKVADCEVAVDQDESGITTMALTGRDDGWSVNKTLTVRVDLEDPSVDVDDSPLAFTARTVAMRGTVSDAFSGPGSVVVRLTPRAGTGSVVVPAECDDCGGAFRGCKFGRDPACGWSSKWHVEVQVEPGVWTAVVEARDIAGNVVQRQPVDLIVLP